MNTEKPMDTEKFAEFLTFINECYQLSDSELNEIKQSYQDIYQDIERFKETLANKLGKKVNELAFFKSVSDSDKAFYVFMLLSESFDCYFDDWAFYCEDLCEYISKYTKQNFEISDEEVEGNIDVVVSKLENETDYSLLHLWSGSDDVHFWLIKKSDKPKILQLANELGLWLD